MASISTASLVFSTAGLNFENSILRPNGNLLLTTITNCTLLEIDPTAADPQSTVIATFGDHGVLGIDSIGDDKYAIAAGIPSSGLSAWSDGSIYTIDLSSTGDSPATPEVVAHIDGAGLLDGLVTVPTQPSIVLVSDALAGAIYRVNMTSGTSAVAVQDDALAGSPGVNGLKIRDGYVYFVNTQTRVYGRFAIADDGQQAGAIEVVATEASSDDFALDANGVAYLGNQSAPSVVRILPNGTKTEIATSADMGRPCSLDLSGDGVTGYVTTASGQVFKFDVPAL
jgi:hypothetical protein